MIEPLLEREVKMPFVQIIKDPTRVNGECIQKLVQSLPGYVAYRLSTPHTEDAAGKLSVKDVDVVVQDQGPHDVMSAECVILIWTRDLPSRRKDLKERTEYIARELRNLLPLGIRTYVRVMLAPAASVLLERDE